MRKREVEEERGSSREKIKERKRKEGPKRRERTYKRGEQEEMEKGREGAASAAGGRRSR